MDEKWIDHILSWQNLSGCFSETYDAYISSEMNNFNNENCTSHMTSLGIATISLFSRIVIMKLK